jgi:hypothetical protein
MPRCVQSSHSFKIHNAFCVHTTGLPRIDPLSTILALAYCVILALDSMMDWWLSIVVHTLLAIYDRHLEKHQRKH